MRIAFASCTCTRVYRDQPVWDWIAREKPDHLVLLGDSVYLDVTLDGVHPSDLSDDDFAQRLFALYGELLAQPSFRKLVQGMPADGRVWSIWDDHDFLWNDANGAAVAAQPKHAGKIRLSTAFQEAFRKTLAQRLAPGSYPDVYNRAEFWDPAQKPLTTPSVALEPGLWLHLSDGRTNRTNTVFVQESKRNLLGAAQRARLEKAVKAAPADVHLLASGSVLATYKRYAVDWAWLNSLATDARMLVLSGDIHRNESDAFHTGGFPLHEATSSGAAVKDAVAIGSRRRNYGLLDVDAGTVAWRLFADDVEEVGKSRKLARADWLPVP